MVCMLETGAAMPSGYPNSICDTAVWMRHTLNLWQMARLLSGFRGSIWIFTYTQTCLEQLSVPVSLVKPETGSPGQQPRAIVAAPPPGSCPPGPLFLGHIPGMWDPGIPHRDGPKSVSGVPAKTPPLGPSSIAGVLITWP